MVVYRKLEWMKLNILSKKSILLVLYHTRINLIQYEDNMQINKIPINLQCDIATNKKPIWREYDSLSD